MKPDELGLPTVIVPYPGPSLEDGVQDIFVNLRPETNGVIAESAMLKVVKTANQGRKLMELIYLANYPGEFIVQHRIIEQVYGLRFHFAVLGRQAFTPSMLRSFADWFQVDPDQVPLVGAFEALEILGMEPEELFEIWVADKDFVLINGQIVKKIKKLYVINYDIPALLHKNSKNTDIAVMVFRTSLAYQDVKTVVSDMHHALCGIGVLDPQFDAARAFHFSKSPLEQVMDAIAYIYTARNGDLGLEDITFTRWLMEGGYDARRILDYLKNPIVKLNRSDGRVVEDNLTGLTQYKTYDETLAILNRIQDTVPLVRHGPLLDKINPRSGTAEHDHAH